MTFICIYGNNFLFFMAGKFMSMALKFDDICSEGNAELTISLKCWMVFTMGITNRTKDQVIGK